MEGDAAGEAGCGQGLGDEHFPTGGMGGGGTPRIFF